MFEQNQDVKNIPVGFEAHFDPHDISEEWRSDFYAYFDAPENATRYTPAVQYLNDTFPGQFTLLDLACGSGSLIPHLPNRCEYVGVDHSEEAIAFCQSRFSKQTFLNNDVLQQLSEFITEGVLFDAIVMCGLLFNTVDKDTQQKVNDLQILQWALDYVLSDRGIAVLIVPFVYSDHPTFSLMSQANWKLQAILRLLNCVRAHISFQNMSLQLGLDRRIAQQAVHPDWYTNDSDPKLSRWHGKYMGCWTIGIQPRKAVLDEEGL